MPIRVGIDLVAVAAVAAALGGEQRDRYLRRVYTEGEVEDCRDGSGAIAAERLAARFAAKEAAIKALPGAGAGLALTAIEVRSGEDGEPVLALSGRAAEIASEAGLTELALSLTHEGEFAAAVVALS